MTEYRSLAGRIRRTLEDLEVLVGRIESFLDKARLTSDEAYLHAAALDLHGFYTGVEQAFQAIARGVDDCDPLGAGWHRELLLQMSTEIPDVRPPVITTDTERCLDAYRGFRHVVRNVYTINLDPNRVFDLGAGVRDCHAQLVDDLTAFVAFLDALDEAP